MKFLTSDQTKRLKDLAAREGDLNAAELSELNFLRQLAEDSQSVDAGEEGEGGPEGVDGEDADSADGEESDIEEEEEEEDQEEVADENASDDPKKSKLSIFDRANAVLSSKAKLAEKASVANADLDAANARIAELEAENKKLQSKAAQGEALAKRVAELEHESTTVSQRAASIAATHHVEDEDLPPSTPEGSSPDDVEDLRAQIRDEKDLKKKAELVQKVKQLRSAALN